MLGGGPHGDGDGGQRLNFRERASSSEEEPQFMMTESPSPDNEEKGYNKLMAGLVGENPLKGMAFLKPRPATDSAQQEQTISYSAAMDFE